MSTEWASTAFVSGVVAVAYRLGALAGVEFGTREVKQPATQTFWKNAA
jgi:hypothetical protein